MKRRTVTQKAFSQLTSTAKTIVGKSNWKAVNDGVNVIRLKMKETGLKIEAEHARDVATAGRVQRELRHQIRVVTVEGERQWKKLKESVKRLKA